MSLHTEEKWLSPHVFKIIQSVAMLYLPSEVIDGVRLKVFF